MRQNHRAFAGAFERADDMLQKGIVTILGRRHAIAKAAIEIIGGVKAGAPRLHREGHISHHKVKGLELTVGVGVVGRGQRVALPDLRRGVVVQNHIHLGQGRGGVVHLLGIDRHPMLGLIRGFEQQRTGTYLTKSSEST